MSMKRMKRAFSLLIAVLMIARALMPAVSTLKPSTAASNVDIAGGSFPETTSAVDACGAVAGTGRDLLFFSGKSRSRSVSWVQTPASTGVTGGTGVDASPAAGTARVVTGGSGRAMSGSRDHEATTTRRWAGGRSAPGSSGAGFDIRLVNAVPDLDSFTEIVEITAHRAVTLDRAKDILTRWMLQSGNRNGNAARAEWYVREERPHNVEFSIIEYRSVTLKDAISMGIVPENVTPEDVAPEDVVPDESTPGTVTIRVPCIAGTKTVERSWPEWVPLTLSGQTLDAGETRLFKVVYTRAVGIGAVPRCRGVADPEVAWWSTAWSHRVPITIASPPPVDGHPHRQVVAFRPGMRSDFGDVRFVTDDGTLLDCSRETYTASDSAVIRVNLPAGVTSIWMYYGDAFARRDRQAGSRRIQPF